MTAAYAQYSASATGGNGFARDFLAGMCALYTGPMYKKLKPQKSSFLLFGVSVAVCIPVFLIYRYGPAIRERSKFAKQLADSKERRSAKHDAFRSQQARQENLKERA